MSIKIDQKRILDRAAYDLKEGKIIKKFGSEKGHELLDKLTNRTLMATKDKLGENLKFEFSERKDNENSISTYYSIEATTWDGKVVGEIQYKVDESLHSVHLSYIGLKDTSYQGKGVGSMLLKYMEDIIKELEISYIEGTFCPIGELGDKSRDFYERHGYKIEFDPCDRKTCLGKHLELNLEDERD